MRKHSAKPPALRATGTTCKRSCHALAVGWCSYTAVTRIHENPLEITLSIHHITQGSYLIDVTPSALPDSRFAAHAVVTHQVDKHVEDLWPAFDPFLTEAEAASAAHMAALAWVAHRNGDAKPSTVT